MADHPETVSLRLAEAATPGPWHHDHNTLWSYVTSKPRGYGVPIAGAFLLPRTDAAFIAHAHPGRVAAYARCVARLRARVAEGHTDWRCPDADGSTHSGPCTCGYALDLAALGAVATEDRP